MWDDMETAVKPHFYILDDSGKPRPPYQSTEVNAIENAKALAAAEPGVEFVVYKAVHVLRHGCGMPPSRYSSGSAV